MVASAAPMTCLPSGSITNINIGSSIMFRTPPILSPKKAFEESPMLLSIDDTVLLNITGTPPRTTTKNMYCLEYSSTLSLAPRKIRSDSQLYTGSTSEHDATT